MNIFDNYLSIINKLITKNKKKIKIKKFRILKNINLEVPPEHFNYDLSCNIALVLSKIKIKIKRSGQKLKKIMEEYKINILKS